MFAFLALAVAVCSHCFWLGAVCFGLVVFGVFAFDKYICIYIYIYIFF